MSKVKIFYGPNSEFEKRTKEIVGKNFLTFTQLIQKIEDKEVVLRQNGEERIEREKEEFEYLVITSGEFLSVRSHVIENFNSIISFIKVKNIYMQNPPNKILEQVQAEKEKFEYLKVTDENIRRISQKLSNRVIGQEDSMKEVIRAIYPLYEKEAIPKVILFYGPPGVGKTETAKVIGEQLKGEILRKQLSMYRTNEFFDYLLGRKHGERCFSKDLLEREVDVVLLDEFDKCSKELYGAFYQIFDEGIFEDNNYKVELKNTIIICTTNYTDEESIKKNIGEALYSRFNAIIKFQELSIQSKKKIFENEYKKMFSALTKKNKNIIEENQNLKERMLSQIIMLNNVREIRKFISECFSTIILKKMGIY